METKSVLLDVLKHTAGLGIIEQVKITGTGSNTRLDAMDPNRTVILSATMHKAVAEFEGEFGIGNLAALSSLSKLSDYSAEHGTVALVREERSGEVVPTTILFKNANGSKDEYRVMSKDMVDKAMTIGKFKGADWRVTVQPSAAKVSQLGEVASIYSGVEPTFNVKTDDGNLIFEVGSTEGGIVGRRTFAENVEGTLDSTWSWNLDVFLKIVRLGMSGTCVIQFSDQGVCQIDVDSGIGVYSYILPAISR